MLLSLSKIKFGCNSQTFLNDLVIEGAALTASQHLRVSPNLLLYSLAINVSIKTVQLTVQREKRYQKITNFGGAFTGSVSHILQQLPKALQDHVYR